MNKMKKSILLSIGIASFLLGKAQQIDSTATARKEVYNESKKMYDQIDRYLAAQTGAEAHTQQTELWLKSIEQLQRQNQHLQIQLDTLQNRLHAYEERLAKFEIKKATEHEAFSTILDLILFEQGSYALTSDARKKIAEIAAKHPEKTLRLVAYTDRIGNDAFNKSLAYERALAVQNELIHDGFKPAQIEMDSKGKFDESHQSISEQECRRVEIRY